MTIRTFIALEFPESELNKIIEIRNINFLDYQKLQWEPINKLHLTLRFLGNTQEEIIPLIISKLEQLLKQYKSLNLSFQKFGVFIKDSKPKIFWVGLNDNKELTGLVKDIDNLITEFGFEREKRKFKPHITLLRIRDRDKNYLNDILNLTKIELPIINFEAKKITFFKSTLSKSGSVYDTIKSFYLKK